MVLLSLMLTAASAVVFTEFVGYWLHVLLHSEKIEFLSRNHMVHHLVVYAPDKPMRPSREYLESTYGRASLLGLGVEWFAPVAILLALTIPTLRAFGLTSPQQAVFVAVSLTWGWVLFNYMHDAMHLKGFWMEGSGVFREWFLEARRRHDIHHMDLAPSGRMTKNFGICFFWFDRLFGSFEPQHRKFDQAALAEAKKRYSFIF